MGKRSSTFSSSAVFVALLSATVEVAILQVPALRAPNDTVMLLEALDRRVEVSPDADVVFLGDSTLRSSVDPHHFEAITGSSAVNLGLVSNGGIYSDLLLLERWLDHHRAPRTVVLVHGPNAFGTDIHRDLYSLLATPSSTVELLLRGSLGKESALDALFHSLLASYRYKPYLRQTADQLLASGFGELEKNRAVWKEFLAERARLGYYPDPPATSPPARGELGDSFVATELNRYAIERLVERTRQVGATLCFFPGPLYAPAATQDRAKASAEQAEVLRTFPGLEVLHTQPIASSDAEVGRQIDHLNQQGAARFTEALAEVLRARARD